MTDVFAINAHIDALIPTMPMDLPIIAQSSEVELTFANLTESEIDPCLSTMNLTVTIGNDSYVVEGLSLNVTLDDLGVIPVDVCYATPLGQICIQNATSVSMKCRHL